MIISTHYTAYLFHLSKLLLILKSSIAPILMLSSLFYHITQTFFSFAYDLLMLKSPTRSLNSSSPHAVRHLTKRTQDIFFAFQYIMEKLRIKAISIFINKEALHQDIHFINSVEAFENLKNFFCK